MFATKLVASSTTRGITALASNQILPAVASFGPQTQTNSRTICHKSKLPPKNVRHWPYEKWSWDMYNCFLDPRTKKKFDENSKIIQVEGNVASGKEQFAKQLAEELGMHYLPPVDIENLYINLHGYDYRALNPLLPERLRYCDWEMFHENPSRHSVIHLLYHMFKLRLVQYVKALQHVFNTGQGVIMCRSAFTERVFIEAMHNVGWLPMGYLREDGVRFYDWRMRYNHTRNMALMRLHKPHLTIYLDTPVETCLGRIKNDPDPMIANSNALTKDFLEAIEAAYKDVVLPKQEYNGHVLTVEHPKHKIHDEIIDVIDEIEPLDFEHDPNDTRFEDWWTKKTLFWHYKTRRLVTSGECLYSLDALHQPLYDIAGLGDAITDADLALRKSLVAAHVGSFGYYQSWESDTRFHSPLKVFIGWMNFGKRLDKCVRNDFA